MAIDRKPQALSWLQRVHRELAPNVNVETFINSFRLNSYGEAISVEDFQEWLQSLGEKLQLSSAVADSVRNAIVVKYSSDKKMIPTRKSLDSAFINLASTAWGFLDAAKVVGLEAMIAGKIMADATGKLVYSSTSILSSGLSILSNKIVLYPVIGFCAWMLWYNRETLSRAFTGGVIELGGKTKDKAIKMAGNPRKRRSSKRGKRK